MLFDEQRVSAERLAIRIDTEAALDHANAARQQRSSQRRAETRHWSSKPARQLISAITGTRLRPRRNTRTSRSRSGPAKSAAPVAPPMRVGITWMTGKTLDVSSSIAPVGSRAARPSPTSVKEPG
jgi:hypothetical protein